MAKGLKVGDPFSYLTLVEKRYVKGNGSKGKFSWVCKCVCGNQVIRREDLFQDGKSMSCGCMHPSKQTRGTKSSLWKGCGLLSGQYFSSVKCGAEKRGIDFNVTIEQAWGLFCSQDQKCALTGAKLEFCTARERKRGLQQSASLDRIDSTKGYIPGNIQWVHKDVNMMKKEFDQERFIEICRLVTQHQAGISTSIVARTDENQSSPSLG